MGPGAWPRANRVWLNTTAGYLVTTAAYDGFGNRTSATTPLGDSTDVLYDATYHVFPIETRDPLYIAGDTRHKTTALWDAVCAAPTENRDLNALPTTQQYDQLCRPTRTDTPGGGFAIVSYNNIGTPTTQYVETQTPPADGSGNIWARTYLDGYGRTWETLNKSPATGQHIRVDADRQISNLIF